MEELGLLPCTAITNIIDVIPSILYLFCTGVPRNIVLVVSGVIYLKRKSDYIIPLFKTLL